MGRAEARNPLKRCLNESPSPRVIEAVAGVADDEAVVFLARIGRARPELAGAIFAALDEIDHERAAAAASGLRGWLRRIHLSRRLVESRVGSEAVGPPHARGVKPWTMESRLTSCAPNISASSSRQIDASRAYRVSRLLKARATGALP